jgi:UDP-N-acetylglucosamine 2-epimerase (non-hydrolysing)
MKTVLIVVGTRPEAIKLIPVYKELVKIKQWKTLIVSTGQHREMIQSVFTFFGVRPDVDLNIMLPDQSLEQLTTKLMHACSDLLKQYKPELLIVQGDTTTAMVASLAAFYQRIKIAHIEAGLRSFDRLAPYPEEVNRRIVSLLADYHFAPTRLSAQHLRQERVQGKVFIVGNTVIDSLLFTQKKVLKSIKVFNKHYAAQLKGFERMVLITGHRRESFGSGFEQICKAIGRLASRYPNISFIYPVHLNPNVKKPVTAMLGSYPNIFLIDPVPYDHMIFLMMHASLILTDSGGIQEEAPTLGKPLLIMRSVTERPEGIMSGNNILCGASAPQIVSRAIDILEKPTPVRKRKSFRSPFGRGDSAKKIASHLLRELV